MTPSYLSCFSLLYYNNKKCLKNSQIMAIDREKYFCFYMNMGGNFFSFSVHQILLTFNSRVNFLSIGTLSV